MRTGGAFLQLRRQKISRSTRLANSPVQRRPLYARHRTAFLLQMLPPVRQRAEFPINRRNGTQGAKLRLMRTASAPRLYATVSLQLRRRQIRRSTHQPNPLLRHRLRYSRHVTACLRQTPPPVRKRAGLSINRRSGTQGAKLRSMQSASTRKHCATSSPWSGSERVSRWARRLNREPLRSLWIPRRRSE